MKILAFVDVHGDIVAINNIENKIKKYKPDLLLCCGDITIFEQFIDIIMYKLLSFGIPMLIIHGNHESENIMKKICSYHKNAVFMHKKIKTINDYTFVGYGGGGFLQTNKDFQKFVQKNEKELKNTKIVLFTHAPPHKTNLDYVHNRCAGCKTFRQFIENHNVVLALSGHLHETAGKQDRIKKTLLTNPGKNGQIIEL